jgi:5'-3' exonuclease
MENKALLVVDGSYFMHFTIASAVGRWEKYSSIAKTVLKPAKETDQTNLPNLTAYPDFCKFLENRISQKLSDIDNMISDSFQDELSRIDIVHKVFTIDAPVANNWRRKEYPSYKAQRKLEPKQYNIRALMDYTENLIRTKFNLEESLNYSIINVNDAEGDDIIATILTRLNDYDLKILVASDRDFLQLEGVNQIDLFGSPKTPLPELCKKKNTTISPKEYLLIKTIIGDKADNIPACFSKIGETKALALVKNKARLKEMLKEDKQAANQFFINKKLIDFSYIPDELSNIIIEKVNTKLAISTEKQAQPIFTDLMNL